MKAYLRTFDLWEVVETRSELPELRKDPIVAQIKQHSEEITKRYKALSRIYLAISDSIFIHIMACEIAKEAWDKFKEQY